MRRLNEPRTTRLVWGSGCWPPVASPVLAQLVRATTPRRRTHEEDLPGGSTGPRRAIRAPDDRAALQRPTLAGLALEPARRHEAHAGARRRARCRAGAD